MIFKKLNLFLLGAISVTLLTSWSVPSQISRRVIPPQDQDYDRYEEKTNRRKDKRQAKIEAMYNATQSKHQTKLTRFADRDGYIWFYDKKNRYTYFLSNFYPCSVQMWGMNFSCAEAAFQAAKFAHDPKLLKRFKDLDGEEALALAQKMSYRQRQDWYQLREYVMAEVIRAKFQQNQELASLLRASGNAYLVEHSKKDSFWADGGDGKGKNQVGNTLMLIRGELGGAGVVAKPHRYKKFVE